MPDESQRGPLVTRSQLISELSDLGVGGFPAVMVHTSMSSIGWIVGGAPTLVDSLLHVLGPSDTLLVLTGWEDRPPYHQDSWAPEEQRACRDECPPFQPSVSRARPGRRRVRGHHPVGLGELVEHAVARLETWFRSSPE